MAKPAEARLKKLLNGDLVKENASSLSKCFDVKQRFDVKPTQLNPTQHSWVELIEAKPLTPPFGGVASSGGNDADQ